MRTALDVLDPVTLELRFELGRAAPGGVLSALIGQDFPRRPIRCDPARKCLQHQHAALMVRHRQAHQVSGVIVQERRHIDTFVTPQQERKKIRLPQLVRLGALEVLHYVFALDPAWCQLRLHAFFTQHPPHRRR